MKTKVKYSGFKNVSFIQLLRLLKKQAAHCKHTEKSNMTINLITTTHALLKRLDEFLHLQHNTTLHERNVFFGIS